ncbi:MAG: hypothetical protein AMJ58_05430 [Gammaproteobacteria bacterium SG8_30]|jgi:NAD(P)-dependent dehydrogenase (short-subunit alcohol dehydrogenase family)|nr:MAG: hypothetical protein AMJ58_05430 [Gammaproteobacteria bacterium SG8_30]
MAATNPFDIRGRRTLITGGTAGIGRAVAEHFVANGAKVVITGRRESGEAIAREMGCGFVRMDVSDAASAASAMAAAVDALGGAIDVLVLNAGVNGPPAQGVDDLSPEALHQVFDTNVFGVAYGLRSAAPHLSQGASVVITSSPAASLSPPGLAIYSASKAAVDAFTRSWALELAGRGIRVNAVLPGVIQTEMAADPANLEAELEMLSCLTATGAIRQPAEIAPVYQFLASAAGALCTGALIACEDGALAGLSPRLLARAFGG